MPHDHGRSRAYRWGEDGIAGICDAQQRLCFALALWNGRDSVLKEEHFFYIAAAMTNIGGRHINLWDDADKVLLRRPHIPRRQVVHPAVR